MRIDFVVQYFIGWWAVIFWYAGSEHGAETDGKASAYPVQHNKSHSLEGSQTFLCISNIE